MQIKHKLVSYISYIKSDCKEAWDQVNFNKKILGLLVILFFLSTFYPSDMSYYKQQKESKSNLVYVVENGLRFINTTAQIIIPILLFDKIGMIQAVYVGLATTVSTKLLKESFNDIHVGDTRIGERPSGKDYNVPSRHSAFVAAAMTFVAIRYGFINLLYLLPVSLLTMITRVLLKAHTISAVISGCILGIIIALLLTSKYEGNFNWSNFFKKVLKKK